jgi:ligand-binding sensor domain-containing protein
MWLGTSTGLNFVNPKDEPVKLVKHSITNPNSLSHNRIGSLALANNGKIWIGTDGGGLDLLDPQTNTFQHFKHNDNNSSTLSNDYVISVFEDSQNRVWVGTYQGGVNLLDPETSISKTYIPEADVRDIFEDDLNQIWVGTNRAGLFKYDLQTDSFQYITELGLIDIRDIEQDQNGSLWLATFGNGIIQFFPESNEFLSFDTKTVSNLPTDVFFSLEILKDENLLIGSRYEGLILLDPNTKSISRFTEADGLSNNSVVSILKENDESQTKAKRIRE